MITKQSKIDVHNHILPPEYLSALAKIGIKETGGRPFPKWTAENSLSVMDKYEIQMSIVSISAPGVYFGDREGAKTLARKCNEFSANLINRYPQRFGAFAVLPLPDVEAALLELEYALDILKLDGVCLLTSVDSRYMGSPEYDELFDELNRRKAIVFMHPDTPSTSPSINLSYPPSLVEYVLETTRAVSNLLFSGTLDRCPQIRFIIPHAGGTIPYIVLRLTLAEFWPGLQEKVPQGVATYLKRLYYDTAISTAPYALRSLQELVDCSHILFASDYPFAPELATMLMIEGLKNYNGFDESALKSVFHENAHTLFSQKK